MYVESPTKTIWSKNITYLGNAYSSGCKEVSAGRYDSGLRTELACDYVYSWRGKEIDFSKQRVFSRKHFKCLTGELAPVFTCTPMGFTDGSPEWGLFTTCHIAMDPIIPWGFDLFDQSASDKMESYRKYMVQELYGKANQPRIQLAVMLAEGVEAISYLKKRLLEALFLHRKYTVLGADLRRPDKLWLEYRYAILPLMLDIGTIQEFLSAEVRKKQKVQHGFKEVLNDASIHTFSFGNSYGENCKYYFRNKTETTYRGGSALWIRAQKDEHPYGLGLHDWIQAGWEKVPLSFIVDWFIDVGGWLASLRDTAISLDSSYATIVKEVKGEISLDCEIGCTLIKAIGRNRQAPIRYEAHWISRTIDIHPPSLPMFTPLKLKWFRQLDAAALLTGYFASPPSGKLKKS